MQSYRKVKICNVQIKCRCQYLLFLFLIFGCKLDKYHQYLCLMKFSVDFYHSTIIWVEFNWTLILSIIHNLIKRWFNDVIDCYWLKQTNEGLWISIQIVKLLIHSNGKNKHENVLIFQHCFLFIYFSDRMKKKFVCWSFNNFPFLHQIFSYDW